MKITDNGHPTIDDEPSDEMLLKGAKAAVDQLHYKANVWDREGYITDKQDWFNAMRHAWKAMEAIRRASP